MVNPCFCGCSLKTAALIIAIIDMIVAAFSFFVSLIGGAVLIGLGVTVTSASDAEKYKILIGVGLGAGIAIVIISLIVFALLFYLALTLKRGADQEDFRKCRIWFIVTAILFVINIFGIIGLIAFGCVDKVNIFVDLAGLVYNAFSMWVVYEFINALRSGQRFDTIPIATYNDGSTSSAGSGGGGVYKF